MARPIKAGVDYFPHDTDASSRKTIFTLESLFGNDGYAFWFKLLETLGTQEGLFFDCNKTPDWLFLIAKMRVSSDTATEILNTLAKIEAIDPELWDKKIIWVQKFADRLNDVYKKRSADIPQKPSFRSENNGFSTGNTNTSEVSAPEMPQREKVNIETIGITDSKPLSPKVEDAGPVTDIQQKRFDEFWAVYPKKVGKKDALKAFKNAKVDSELFDKIMTAIGRARTTEQWQRDNGRYIPNPSTWLNQGRWDDEYKEANTNGEYRSIVGAGGKEPAGTKPWRTSAAAFGFKLACDEDDNDSVINKQHTGPNKAGGFALSGFKPANAEDYIRKHDSVAPGFKFACPDDEHE